jgi:putative transposase
MRCPPLDTAIIEMEPGLGGCGHPPYEFAINISIEIVDVACAGCYAIGPRRKETMMSNYRRWRVQGATYFFTAVTYRRRPILTTDSARAALREALRRVRALQPFEIVAIVLLPDHLHTVWTLPANDSDYSTRWRELKALVTRSLWPHAPSGQPIPSSRRRSGEKLVWQRRFYEHTCRDESDLSRCIDYVHLNPVKHRLVSRVGDWPWSSFHRYVKLGHYESDWGGSPEWFGDEFRWAE